ncbi:DUF2259 domain-containing protein [Cucumibacter marinus]|uniref:DUF2259 domain-containing protein n=1 Tax=Cucumibacter marinus TaxID=1121252 RepID=UPI00040429B5|nr:DUF2259 domain-containing protein [Cucumibacter marinus]
MLRLITGLLAFVLATSQAFAAERALFEALGYSDDGRYFAFEEFGTQDGTGSPYSSIYVIDLKLDIWADGPFRTQASEEEWETPLHVIRTENRDKAADALDARGIVRPAFTIAMNGDGEPEVNEMTLDFGVPTFSSPGAMHGDYQISLEIFPAPGAEFCEDILGELPKGFALLIDDGQGDLEVSRDASVPKSRGCVRDYRPYAVLVPFENYDLAHGVAIVSVYAFGFEGVDRRFIAVPLGAVFAED